MYGEPEEMAGRTRFDSIGLAVRSAEDRDTKSSTKLLTKPVKTVKTCMKRLHHNTNTVLSHAFIHINGLSLHPASTVMFPLKRLLEYLLCQEAEAAQNWTEAAGLRFSMQEKPLGGGSDHNSYLRQ